MSDVQVGITQIEVVQNIDEGKLEPQFDALGKAEVLRDAGIPVNGARPVQDSDPGGAEAADRRRG